MDGHHLPLPQLGLSTWATHNDGLPDHPAQRSHPDTATFQDDAGTAGGLDPGLLGPGGTWLGRLVPKLGITEQH